ncbi:MAG: hypothetical protein WBF33_34390 [Candidatus Nitrosopolaris sp.]|jgi:hypothetical protein
MVIGKVFPVGYGFPKPVLLKLLMPMLLAGVDVFEIIVLLLAVNVVVVAPGGAAIPVLFLSFAIAGLAVVFAVAGLAVVLIRNPLELMEDEFRTFAALVNVARRIIKAIDTATTTINGI